MAEAAPSDSALLVFGRSCKIVCRVLPFISIDFFSGIYLPPCCLISGIATGWGSAEQNLPPSILPASDFQGKRISGVECGLHHTFALTDEGTLFSWGKGGGGRLGHGENQTDVYMPYPSFRLQNDTVDSISLGGMHK